MKRLTVKNILKVPVIALALVAAGTVAEAQTNVTAKLDSAYLLMGKQTTLHIDSHINGSPADIRLLLPEDTLTSKVEIIRATVSDSSVSNGVLTMRHDITIQSFDSGLYTIPPVKMLIGRDTFLSNHTVLKVLPAMVDSLNGKIHDYADTVEPDHHFFDFIPQGMLSPLVKILIALLLIGLGVLAYIYIFKKKKVIFKPAQKPVPPYEEAIAALTSLRAEKLCEKGHEREFYTRLTDILRNYLDRRFGISAMEMTSTEILRELSGNQETKFTRRQMEDILSMADFVKFARLRPLPDDNVRTYNLAVDFVESTKPQPEPQTDASAVKNQTKDNNNQK